MPVPLRVHEGVLKCGLGKTPFKGKTRCSSTLASQLCWGRFYTYYCSLFQTIVSVFTESLVLPLRAGIEYSPLPPLAQFPLLG